MAQAPTLPPVTLNEAETVLRKFVEASGDFAVNFVVAIIILLVTIWASGWLAGVVRKVMARPQRFGPTDVTLQSFIVSLTRYTVLILGLIAVLQQLGVQATSIIAVLGAASLAIGLALQGALSNVAAGVMILVLRPYRVGDVIDVAGKQGTVRTLDLFMTELATFDNVRVFIPNGKIFADVIVNTSAHPTRRVDVVFRVPLAQPAEPVLRRMQVAVAEDSRILKEPQPVFETTSLAEAWVETAVRVWVMRADYVAVRSELFTLARRELEEARFSGDPSRTLMPRH